MMVNLLQRYWRNTLAIVLSCGLTSCVSKINVHDTQITRSKQYQHEIDQLLTVDAENKRWEKVYLLEILAARKNQDQDAYNFYVLEYLKSPRLDLPEWIKKEPGYQQAVDPEDILGEPLKIIIRLRENRTE